MKFPTLQRVQFASEAITDAVCAEHGADVERVEPRAVRLRHPMKLVRLDEAEIREFNRGIPSRPKATPITLLGLLLLFLSLFCWVSTGVAAGVAMPGEMPSTVGGLWAAPAFPLAVEVSNTAISVTALGVLGVFATLLGYHAKARAYIREQAGVKDSKSVEITGQPINFQMAVQFVPMQEFQRLEADVQRREHKILAEVQSVQSAVDERRDEIAEVRAHVDEKLAEAMKEMTSSAGKTHNRIDGLAITQGQLVGEVKQVSTQLTEISRILMSGKAGK